MQKEKLEKLAGKKNEPCVTVSMNTHRTFPDNAQDAVLLKKLLNEAKEKVVEQYGKRDVASLLEKIENVEKNTDPNYNLNSMHIFISNSTSEVVKSPLPAAEDTVQVSDSFAIKPLMRILNQTEDYFIMQLSQSGAKLLLAVNDSVIMEFKNDDFPFDENPHYFSAAEKKSHPEKADNMVREYLNEIDKALNDVYNLTGLKTVVICTEDNYSRLMQVADKKEIYYGYANIDYNDVAEHHLAEQAWKIVSEKLKSSRAEAVKEMQEAVGAGLVVTDIAEIYRSAKEGKGDMLIVSSSFKQAAKINGDNIDILQNANGQGSVEDITSEIAWQVASKQGRVIFIDQEEISGLGKIALKLRF